jgi:Ca-activated chloride channel family protein
MIWRRITLAFALLFLAVAAMCIPYAVLGADFFALRWEHRGWLWALLLAPAVLEFTTVFREKRLPRLLVGSVQSAQKVRPSIRTRLRDLPGILRSAAFIFLILALAQPRTVDANEREARSGIDIMLTLDLSGSMRAADLKPTRVGAAKEVIEDFIQKRTNDRVGAVVFNSEAYLLNAPTLDHRRVLESIAKMDVGVISGDGTAIGEGLGLSIAKLRKSVASSKVAILLTDGDNNSGKMSPEYAMNLAKELGIRIFTIQMGNGDEVEVEVGRDIMGRPHYEKHRFPVNPDLLRKIAHETGGEFFLATETEQLRSSMQTILDQLPKTEFEDRVGDVTERFPIFVFIGTGFLLLEALIRLLLLRRFP